MNAILLRQVFREIRSGKLWVLILGLAMAMGALGAVGMLASRMQALVQQEGAGILGADAVGKSDKPISQELEIRAQKLGLKTQNITEFPTMIPDALGLKMKLSSIKAVSSSYPLRGRVVVRTCETCQKEVKIGGPGKGNIWIEPGLANEFELQVGDLLSVGRIELKITALIELESDRQVGASSFAPRIMMAQEDLESTQLVQSASRIGFKVGVAGSERAIRQLRMEGVVAPWGSELRWDNEQDEQRETQMAIERADSFLSLVSTLSALLSAIAIGLGARSFANSTSQQIALARALGWSSGAVRKQIAAVLLAAMSIAMVVGSIMAFVGHHILVWTLRGLLPEDLPALMLWPLWQAIAIGVFLMVGFATPSLWHLTKITPMEVFRRDEGAQFKKTKWALLGGLISFLAILVWKSASIKLGLIAAGGFLAVLLLTLICNWLVLSLCASFAKGFKAGSIPRMALLGVARRKFSNTALGTGLASGLFALCLLYVGQNDLANVWRSALSQNSPDRFLIGVAPTELAGVEGILKEKKVDHLNVYPMVRMRITAINGVEPDLEKIDPQWRRTFNRELNISALTKVPDGNTLVSGVFNEKSEDISFEEQLANSAGIKVGDKIKFEGGANSVVLRVGSIRKVDWGKIQANFFVLFHPELMKNVVQQTMINYKSPKVDGEAQALNKEILKLSPGALILDTSQIELQVRSIAEKALLAVQVLFIFSVFCGALVLWAALLNARAERLRESSIARALGASNRVLTGSTLLELCILGAAAGFVGSVMAIACGWAISQYVFSLPWYPNLLPVVVFVAIGAAIASISGYLALRSILGRASLDALRSAEGI